MDSRDFHTARQDVRIRELTHLLNQERAAHAMTLRRVAAYERAIEAMPAVQNAHQVEAAWAEVARVRGQLLRLLTRQQETERHFANGWAQEVALRQAAEERVRELEREVRRLRDPECGQGKGV